MKRFRRGKRMAIALHDGESWRAYALQFGQGEWTCAARAEEASRNPRQLPKRLMDFLGQSGARRLRVLLPGEVLALTTALPEDATDEELHTALAYEAQGETGIEAAGHRLAAVRADLHGMGGDRKTILAAGIELEHLERLAADAESEGLALEGAGALDLALLAAHAQRNPNRRLLVVRERISLHVSPASVGQPFAVATLPLGRGVANDSAARERAERARDRLSALAEVPMTLVLANGSEKEREQLACYLGKCGDVEVAEGLELEELAVRIGAGSRPGGVDSPCPWVGLPPEPRDPHRHGSALLGVVVAAAVAWSGMRWHRLGVDMRQARETRAAWERLEQVRLQARATVEGLRDRQGAMQAKKALLEQTSPLPSGLLALLETLAERMPTYSCLESIRQIEGGFEILGVTRWQDGLPQLDAALREMGRREGFRREFGGLEAVEGESAQRFRFEVLRGEDRP
jgi:hypothetical protein